VDLVALLVVIAVLCAVVAVVSAPLRHRGAADPGAERDDRLAELEARKEAKYREIRDAEMDFQTGKLSDADHRALDRQLRAEAIEVLRAIDDEG
jgi:flagellar biosynthesis/type III secretory pathway M-ring protein FliF/YscJ